MVFYPTFFQPIQARKISFAIFQNEKPPFQAIKTRRSKSRTIDIFPKGLTHGFGQEQAIFPTFFFQVIYASKMCFTIFQNEQTPFQSIKTRRSKSPNIEIFPKGLTIGFGSKVGLFQLYFISNIGQQKVFYDILERKTPLQVIKTRSSKSRQIDDILEKGPWFWSKNGPFSNFFFQTIQPRKRSFTIFQNEKTPFQAIKTRSSKSRKIDIFPKGLTHAFGPKMAIF